MLANAEFAPGNRRIRDILYACHSSGGRGGGGEHESWLSTLMGGRCVATPNTALRNFREQGTTREAHLTMMLLRQEGCCTKLPARESHAVSISADETEADIQ
ncbi:hypothetical protein ALC62_04303 [Cyphomyrmex costatus]|uniref:Uncharacterized protein n=1 Tax=Cyphomyrmex costatus TaxID=456900 RepID=A0A195CW59_9HYME|nr:hypothetical protein ALC62_04303 [Cyphomyrmex costatus]